MMPMLIALTQWGDRWVFGENNEPILFLDREHGQPISPVRVYSMQGEALRARDLKVVAGPGASPESKQRLEELEILNLNRQ
jgi:hypothetical protein